MGAWFSSEADEDNTVPNTPSNGAANAHRNAANGAVAPRVNNSAKNVEAANVAVANGATAPSVNNSAKNVEAPNTAANGAAAPRVNNTARNAEKGKRNNSRKNNVAAVKNNASVPKINEPSPAGQEEEGFPPNTQVNIKTQAGGRKRKSKSRKGKGRKGKSRKARK
jgi:hypothetical protein